MNDRSSSFRHKNAAYSGFTSSACTNHMDIMSVRLLLHGICELYIFNELVEVLCFCENLQIQCDIQAIPRFIEMILIKDYEDGKFRRLPGVMKETFAKMLKVLETELRDFGRPTKLDRADQLLLTLMFWRGYRT